MEICIGKKQMEKYYFVIAKAEKSPLKSSILAYMTMNIQHEKHF